jgi:hypothetical protein
MSGARMKAAVAPSAALTINSERSEGTLWQSASVGGILIAGFTTNSNWLGSNRNQSGFGLLSGRSFF